MSGGKNSQYLLDASDIWLVPRNGRVVFDARGNSSWQWPGDGDPFAEQDNASNMDAADLRIAEPTEIRRSQLPWLHESERRVRPRLAANMDLRLHTTTARTRIMR
jgi:hypothetical protein